MIKFWFLRFIKAYKDGYKAGYKTGYENGYKDRENSKKQVDESNAINKIHRWWEPPIICTDIELEAAHRAIRSHQIDIIEYRKILYGDRYKEAHGI